MSREIKLVKREQHKFFFDKEVEPVAYIKPGESIIFETEDANVSLIQKETDVYDDFSKLYAKGGGCNPVTGPVYIEGAKPGDVLAVKLTRIIPGPIRKSGYTAVYPGLGALSSPFSIQEPLEPRTKICPIDGDKILFTTHDKDRTIEIPLQPFIGTIGVAPKEERRVSFYHGKDFCGNVDCSELKTGATICLPVNVEGALLSIGDVHAVQGDGEITGCALECQGIVEVKVDLLKNEEAQYGEWPQVNTDETIGSLVCLGGINLSDAIRAGYVDLVNRMVKYYGFDKIDAYQLLNLAGEVKIGQVLESMYSCVVKIDRRYLK